MTMVEGLDDETDLIAVAQQLPEPSDLIDSDDEAPIIRLINALLTQAVKDNASDIHIEPYENRMTVRFRIDGVLREVLQSKRAVAPIVVSRIKVMSKLDIAEKRLPQDGRISLRIAGRAVDVRVSTIPSGHGERVVLRLLDKQAGRLTLSNLGMSDEDQALMDELVHRPHGILLVTGPDGLGQDDDALRRARADQRPLEQHPDRRGPDRVPHRRHRPDAGQHEGRNDVRARPARDPAPGPRRRDGRRDPRPRDGRDRRAGELDGPPRAVDAAHEHGRRRRHAAARHGRRAVPAVVELDRRARAAPRARARPGHCACRIRASEYECRLLNVDPANPPTLYRAPADDHGYQGRTGIYELVKVDNTMRTMIHDGAGEHELERYARTLTPSIREDGVRKILAGVDDARRGRPSHAGRLMGAYQYVAVDPGGKEHRGILEGDTPRHVRQLLRDRQLLPGRGRRGREREERSRAPVLAVGAASRASTSRCSRAS